MPSEDAALNGGARVYQRKTLVLGEAQSQPLSHRSQKRAPSRGNQL